MLEVVLSGSLDFPGESLARPDPIGCSRSRRAPAALPLAAQPGEGLTGTACPALPLSSLPQAQQGQRFVLPRMPQSQLGCHSAVALKENGIVAPGEQDGASLGETGCRERERREKWMGSK